MELLEDTQVDSTENASINIPSEKGLISNGNIHIIQVVNNVILCTFVSVFGIVTNAINLVVFLKQGLDTTINISFFALAISDLCSLILQLWVSICFNPLFQKADILIAPLEIMYVSGLPRMNFSRITFLITVYITVERFLCVVFPLKIKQMITPRRTAMIICAILILPTCSSIPMYFTNKIEWKFYPELNKTLLGYVIAENRTPDRVIYIITTMLGIIIFVAVVVLTAVLTGKVKQKNNWRNMTKTQSLSTSFRDRKLVNLVILIAGILIASYTPSVLLLTASFFEPGLAAAGRYSDLFDALLSFVFVFETINSSVNIFLYFKMSSKYRDTFRMLFLRCYHVSSKRHSDAL